MAQPKNRVSLEYYKEDGGYCRKCANWPDDNRHLMGFLPNICAGSLYWVHAGVGKWGRQSFIWIPSVTVILSCHAETLPTLIHVKVKRRLRVFVSGVFSDEVFKNKINPRLLEGWIPIYSLE